jgi:hypothetical protein
MSGNNFFSGRVPLNLRKNEEEVAKSTSYRDGITHHTEVRIPKDREIGCTPLRRFPNGQLDAKYVAQTIVDLVHKVMDGGNLTEFEKAVLTSILPSHFDLMDKHLAGTMAKMSDEEKAIVALLVQGHLGEELNWNAGRGGGSVPVRHMTRS